MEVIHTAILAKFQNHGSFVNEFPRIDEIYEYKNNIKHF